MRFGHFLVLAWNPSLIFRLYLIESQVHSDWLPLHHAGHGLQPLCMELRHRGRVYAVRRLVRRILTTGNRKEQRNRSVGMLPPGMRGVWGSGR